MHMADKRWDCMDVEWAFIHGSGSGDDERGVVRRVVSAGRGAGAAVDGSPRSVRAASLSHWEAQPNHKQNP